MPGGEAEERCAELPQVRGPGGPQRPRPGLDRTAGWGQAVDPPYPPQHRAKKKFGDEGTFGQKTASPEMRERWWEWWEWWEMVEGSNPPPTTHRGFGASRAALAAPCTPPAAGRRAAPPPGGQGSAGPAIPLREIPLVVGLMRTWWERSTWTWLCWLACVYLGAGWVSCRSQLPGQKLFACVSLVARCVLGSDQGPEMLFLGFGGGHQGSRRGFAGRWGQ